MVPSRLTDALATRAAIKNKSLQVDLRGPRDRPAPKPQDDDWASKSFRERSVCAVRARLAACQRQMSPENVLHYAAQNCSLVHVER